MKNTKGNTMPEKNLREEPAADPSHSERKHPAVPEEFLVTLQGKQFVLYAGLLALAHERGLEAIETALVHADYDTQTFTVKATVFIRREGTEGSDGPFHRFDGYGDASPKNTAPRVATACLRMAETRAKARALRDATNVGITAFEELPDLEEEQATGERRAAIAGNAHERGEVGRPIQVESQKVKCAARRCTTHLDPQAAQRATARYGEVLCPRCGALRDTIAAATTKHVLEDDPFADEYRPRADVLLKRTEMLTGMRKLLAQAREKAVPVFELKEEELEEIPNEALYSFALSIKHRLNAQAAVAAATSGAK